ncbi:MAG: hypothetical protein ACRBBW_20530 [Cellvibrionaceae bacterium]
MTLLSFENFSGIAPKIRPKKLGEALAVTAQNVRFDSGSLAPWRGISFEENAVAGAQSLYRYDGGWLTSSAVRNFVNTLLANDTRQRLFYTDEQYPKMRSGADEYKLGLPRPSSPVATIQDAGDKTNITDVRNQRYVVTLVDAWRNEGPSSAATISVEVGKDGIVRVDLSSCTVTGNYNLGAGALFRIYRTNNSSTGGNFQYVAEVAYGTGYYDDAVAPGDLQELLRTQEWVAAPDDDTSLYPDGPLKGLVELPGGTLVGYTGNTVFFSEPFVPHAWPYYYPFEQKVRGLAVIQGGVFVATESSPYLLTGSSPDAMLPVPVESGEACASDRSVVDMGDYALYVSPNGLVMAQGGSAELITGEYFDLDTWSAFQPATVRGFRYGDKYLGFYGDITDGTGFIYDPNGGTAAFTTFTGLEVSGGYRDPMTDTLYLVYFEAGVAKVGAFDRGSPLELLWKSKEILVPDPINLSNIRILAKDYPVTVELIADGISKGEWAFPDGGVHRLPAGYIASTWQVGIKSTGVVDGVFLSNSAEELP